MSPNDGNCIRLMVLNANMVYVMIMMDAVDIVNAVDATEIECNDLITLYMRLIEPAIKLH